MIEAYLCLIGIGILLCIIRMILGPTSPDRAVALDTLSTVTTAMLVILGFYFKRRIYLDVALVYAVLTFIGSVAIARYLEKGV
ncbi:MAG: cation:proton antiporter [Spirochaetes bacterium]|nr:MAG: cation:proton antiporter [Spirochaetota bacterium]